MADVQPIDETYARNILNTKGVAALYDYLGERGYEYAELAKGVTDPNSLTGQAAIRHMHEIANNNGQTLSDQKVNQISVTVRPGLSQYR